MDLKDCVLYVGWLETQVHARWPFFNVWYDIRKASFDTTMYSFWDIHPKNISSCFLLCWISISDIFLHLIQPCVHGIVHDLDRSPLYYRARDLHMLSKENLHLESLGLCMPHWYRHRWIRGSSHELDSLWEARVSNVFPPILAGLGSGWKVSRKRWVVAERHQGS